jgi:hypothetical protein
MFKYDLVSVYQEGGKYLLLTVEESQHQSAEF